MRVSKIRISNCLGIDDLAFEAGTFNAFVGENGAGKTSALNAVKAALGRDGDDATLLRDGADKGEIVLVMDDDTTITKTLTPGAARTTIHGGPEGKVSATATLLKGLTDALSVNPVAFILSSDTPAEKRQRLQWLLECLPVTIDQDRLTEMAGAAVKVADPNWPAFDQLEAVRRSIFDDRTATNRAIDEKQGSINQLQQTLPEDEAGAAVVGDPDSLQAQLDAMDAAHTLDLQSIADKLADYERQSGDRARTIRDSKDAERAGLRERIKALEAQVAALDAAQAEALASETAWMTDTRTKAHGRREERRAAHAEARAPHAATLSAIRAGANALARAAATRAHIKTFADTIRGLEEDAATMTRRLAAIQAYKSDLLANIPIDGLTVEDGEIFRHGIPFDRLNTAQKVDMAVEIAKLRASRAGIICVDGIESLDPTQYAAFRAKSVDSGLQLFVTRVTDGPLAVQTA